ncbi:transposable element Tc1 transposase [Trichonephila clavipes]|nr:transposable element Tc1 transposase [Trichonephila clavipes]
MATGSSLTQIYSRSQTESRFNLWYHEGRIHVRRYAGEHCLPECAIEGYIGLTPGVMVWGVISYHERSNLLRIEGNLNSNSPFKLLVIIIIKGRQHRTSVRDHEVIKSTVLTKVRGRDGSLVVMLTNWRVEGPSSGVNEGPPCRGGLST